MKIANDQTEQTSLNEYDKFFELHVSSKLKFDRSKTNSTKVFWNIMII